LFDSLKIHTENILLIDQFVWVLLRNGIERSLRFIDTNAVLLQNNIVQHTTFK
jgi:hypothetical protein